MTIRPHIAIIGTGNMGQALLTGLRRAGVPSSSLRIVEANASLRRTIARRYRVRAVSLAEAVSTCDVMLLAVKPQQFPDVMGVLAPAITARHLVISIAAGITLRWLKARLPKARLVRVMPNLPATVQRGFSALAFGSRVNSSDRRLVGEIFRAVGDVCELPERHFDAITAVSGSGPAYVFFLVQAWQEAARQLGLPPAVAARAIAATVRGAEAILAASSDAPETWIARVASKKGTTEAALKVLARRRVAAHVAEAVKAAAARSRALAWT